MKSKERTLEDLYFDELRDLQSAEQQLIKALPKLVKAAQSQELQEAFEDHLEKTREHASRLDEILKEHDGESKPKKCKGMAGLITEGEEVKDDNEDSPTLDAALISAAQRVEHYEIAGYGTVIAYARCLGFDEDVGRLEETLVEEREADATLTELAEQSLNAKAEEGQSGRKR